jgi:cation:H+ antiporter
MDLNNILWLIAGLVVITLGADILVRGASRLAAAAKISPLVIGLTVVAFGTSAPELAVSLKSTLVRPARHRARQRGRQQHLQRAADPRRSALIAPLRVAAQLIKVDTPLMVLVSLAAWGVSLDGRISPVDGWILAAGLVAYVAMSRISAARRARRCKTSSRTNSRRPPSPGRGS